jgi:hypothetical protein
VTSTPRPSLPSVISADCPSRGDWCASQAWRSLLARTGGPAWHGHSSGSPVRARRRSSPDVRRRSWLCCAEGSARFVYQPGTSGPRIGGRGPHRRRDRGSSHARPAHRASACRQCTHQVRPAVTGGRGRRGDPPLPDLRRPSDSRFGPWSAALRHGRNERSGCLTAHLTSRVSDPRAWTADPRRRHRIGKRRPPSGQGRAGGRPRLISDGGIEVIVTAARTRPEKLGQPFTHWSLRKLAGYLAGPGRPVRIGRERLRQLLHERGISFQRTRTWKESTDPDRDAKLDRTEYVTSACPDRCFASGQFGPLSIRPCHGVCWAPRKPPACWPPSAANAPASAANASNAGAARNLKPHSRAGARS